MTVNLDDIRSKLDIVDLIEESGIRLTAEGGEYKGAISPTSKSGKSLHVNRVKQIYNDFSGHAGGGDAFNWLAYVNGLDIKNDFVQVLHIAAEKTGIVLDNNIDYSLVAEKRELHLLNRIAFTHYNSLLTEDKIEYIQSKWGTTKEIIDNELIGWAPENCRLQQVPEIKDYFSTEILEKSGLFYCNDDGKLVDIYRGRFVFPYWHNGEPVYSIARDPKWDKDKTRKKFIKQLVNSEKFPYVSHAVENVLYGIDSLKGNDTVYVTEGIADAIALKQAGKAVLSPVTIKFKDSDINNVVETCKSKKLVKIVNDNEDNESGLKGAMSTAKALYRVDIPAEIVMLPRPDGVDKIDVAEYLLKHDMEELDAIAGQSVWEILLDSTNVPEKELDRPRAAKQFVETHLTEMRRLDRKTFCLTAVKRHFQLSTESMRDVLKIVQIRTGADKYYTGDGKFVPIKLSEDIQKDHTFATFGKEIWVYHQDTGCYQPDGEIIIRKKTRDVLEDDSIEKHGNEVVYDVAICSQANRAEFDSENEFVNLQNGYVNIFTGEFFQHSPERKFTSALPIVYDPTAICPKFDEFIQCTGVGRTQILEAFAYCLVPRYPIHTFIIFIGDGGNGKGTLIRLLGEFLGSHNTKHYTMQELAKDRYAKGGLFGKYANLCGDMPSNYIEDMAIIKTLSGDDTITARNIYGEPFDFTNRAKLIFSMNHIPKFDDTTDSTFRRILVVEFNNRVQGLTEGFKESDLADEIPGIFNEALKVLPALLERGDFTGVKSVEETREYIMDRADSVAAFLKHCTEEGSGRTKTQDAYTAYTKYCREKGETRKDNRVFGRRIKDLCSDVMKVSAYEGSNKIYYYSGLEVKDGYTGLNSNVEDQLYLTAHNNRLTTDHQQTNRKNVIIQEQENDLIENRLTNSTIFKEKLREKKDGEKNVLLDSRVTCDDLLVCNDKNMSKDSEKHVKSVNLLLVGDAPALDLLNTVNELIAIWQQQSGERIYKKTAHKALLDIPKMQKARCIDYTFIEAVVKKLVQSRCVDCGSDAISDKSEVKIGSNVYASRCRECYIEYQKLTPVKLPETEVLI